MALPHSTAAYTLIGIAQKFQAFFYGDPQDVEFEYMDVDGNIKKAKVPNVAKVKRDLEQSAVTEAEWNERIKDYYKKLEVDAIKQDILNHFDKYYTKKDVDDKINALDKETKKLINELVEKNLCTTYSQWENERVKNKHVFAGDGVVGTNIVQFEDGGYKFNNLAGLPFVTRQERYIKGNKNLTNIFSLGAAERDQANVEKIVNISGVLVNLNSRHSYDIRLPEAPTVKFVTDNSRNIPDTIEPKEFIILKDYDRELVKNGQFDNGIDGWYSRYSADKIEYDSDNKRMKVIKERDGTTSQIVQTELTLFANTEYLISFEIKTDGKYDPDPRIWLRAVGNWNINTSGETSSNIDNIAYFKRIGDVFYFRVKPNRNINKILISAYNRERTYDKNTFYLDNVSCKQTSEAILVAATKFDKLEDLYTRKGIENLLGLNEVVRNDIVLVETWLEDITRTDAVYWNGAVNFNVGDILKIGNYSDANWFTGSDHYHLFGDWQEPGETMGGAYRWSKLSPENKRKLLTNPEFRLIIRGDKVYQERWRYRVIKGLGNLHSTLRFTQNGGSWNRHFGYPGVINARGQKTTFTDLYACVIEPFKSKPIDGFTKFVSGYSKLKNPGLWDHVEPYASGFQAQSGEILYALPIANIQRLNKGLYHPVFNKNGSAKVYYSGEAKYWSEVLPDYIDSKADCFNDSIIAAISTDNKIVSADDNKAEFISGDVLSNMSGRSDSAKYHNVITKKHVEDLRYNANNISIHDLLTNSKFGIIEDTIPVKRNLVEFNKYNEFRVFSGKISGFGTAKTNKCNGIRQDIYWRETDGIEMFEPASTIIFKSDLSIGSWMYWSQRYSTNSQRYHIHTDYKYKFYSYGGTDCNHILGRLKDNSLNNKLVESYTTLFNKALFNVNMVTVADIIGDPRPLNERVIAETKTGSKLDKLYQGEYVLCKDHTKNNGKEGHYYAYKGDATLENINTDGTDGSANATNGHIDFSDTNKWIDLGDDGSLFGYPESWFKYGILGEPSIVDRYQNPMLPLHGFNSNNIKLQKPIWYDKNNKRLVVELRHDVYDNGGNKEVVVVGKNGYQKFGLRGSGYTLNVGFGKGVTSDDRNNIWINLNDETLEKLGFESIDEALAGIVVFVQYETYAHNLIPFSTMDIKDFDNTIWKNESNNHTLGNTLQAALVGAGKTNVSKYNNSVLAKFAIGNGSANAARIVIFYKEVRKTDGVEGDDGTFPHTNHYTIAYKDINGKLVNYGNKFIDLPYYIPKEKIYNLK